MEDESEWEETLVHVELCGVSGTQLFPSEGGSQQAEILGLASERPLMTINGHTFAGRYEDTIGTHLIMAGDEKNSPTGSEGSSSSGRNWEYLCKTDKKLVMQPAFLVEKTATTPTPAAGDSAVAAATATAAATEPSAASSDSGTVLLEKDPPAQTAT
ncbi:general transcription factor 3C polypeptide 6-like [Babylonia areolata]|uniref:general transcription factor 3C polypeptide 6-like n=1 Tax=Babylonia areolata TaxID=304850 RepID=UPI003FD516F3